MDNSDKLVSSTSSRTTKPYNVMTWSANEGSLERITASLYDPLSVIQVGVEPPAVSV